MSKKIHFISGTPLSEPTLLADVLRQNPHRTTLPPDPLAIYQDMDLWQGGPGTSADIIVFKTNKTNDLWFEDNS